MDYFFNNILENGCIRASPSTDPDYNFHWVRDSAIVMKAIASLYEANKENEKYRNIIYKYIETELEHIKYHPAEPKFLLDKTPYTGDWGRPQNDGPALRGLVCLKLLKLVPKKTSMILKIIKNDLMYTIDEIDQPCFDLWEEQFGYHLYTRIVQTKFLHEANNCNKLHLESLNESVINKANELLSHHFSENKIYSSYSLNGSILREYDSSVLLGLCHIDYDLPGYSIFDNRIVNYCYNMKNSFTEIYPLNKKINIPFLGRYFEDKYFGGNPWIISTISLFHYLLKTDKLKYHKEEYYNFIKFLLEKKMDLPEQVQRENGTNISVDRLTWNYSEIIMFCNSLKNSDIVSLFYTFL